MKRVVVLGSTGSIGRQALDIAREHADRITIAGLVANRDVGRLAEQIVAFQPEVFAVGDAESGARLLHDHPEWKARCAGFGAAAVTRVAATRADIVLNGLLGYAGLRPSLAALAAGSDLALANKESMVVAGELLHAAADATGARIVPVDSEHSAIDQCLRAGQKAEVRRLVLTASGGPFRTWTRDRMRAASLADALRHPTWSMGAKISIDSATLMNKGLEILEAHALFGFGYDAIDVVVHPQSIVHSMVEFVDGSVVAQLGTTDMRLPIWYALHAPDRAPADFGRLDLAQVGTLSFEALDAERFPCVGLAVAAGRRGGTAPAILNAANEVAVAALLEERIRYIDIPSVIESTLAATSPESTLDVDTIAVADQEARRIASERVGWAHAPGAPSW